MDETAKAILWASREILKDGAGQADYGTRPVWIVE